MGRKISVILLAVCLVTAFSVHAADIVYSKNAVGFGKTVLGPDDFGLFSPGFEGMETADIQEALDGQLSGAVSATAADQCLLWDTGTQTYLNFYKFDSSGGLFGGALDDKWVVTGSGFPPLVATQEVNLGSAFWLKNNQTNTQEVILKGNAPVAPTGTVEMVEGLTFFSYPYAADIDLNTSPLGTLGKGAVSATAADQILAWDQDNQVYKNFYLFDSGSGLFGGALDNKWVVTGSGFPPLVATQDISLVRGYWYQRSSGAGTLTWNSPKPYDL